MPAGFVSTIQRCCGSCPGSPGSQGHGATPGPHNWRHCGRETALAILDTRMCRGARAGGLAVGFTRVDVEPRHPARRRALTKPHTLEDTLAFERTASALWRGAAVRRKCARAGRQVFSIETTPSPAAGGDALNRGHAQLRLGAWCRRAAGCRATPAPACRVRRRSRHGNLARHRSAAGSSVRHTAAAGIERIGRGRCRGPGLGRLQILIAETEGRVTIFMLGHARRFRDGLPSSRTSRYSRS